MRSFHFVLTAPVVLFWALGAAETPPAPTPPPPLPGLDAPPSRKGEGPLPEVDWSAVKQSFVETDGLVILTGSAWVRAKGMKLEADHIVYYRKTQEMYAEGNVRLLAGESEITAQVAYMDVTHDTGYVVDAVVRVSTKTDRSKARGTGPGGGGLREDKFRKRDELRQSVPLDSTTAFLRTRDPYGVYLVPADDPQARVNLMFKAARLIKKSSRLYTAEDAYITTDDMVHPMYGLNAGEMEFHLITEAEAEQIKPPRHKRSTEAEPNQSLVPSKIVARGARINILGFSLFPFPKVTYDIVQGYPFYSLSVGRSSIFGRFAANRFGYQFGTGEDKLFALTRVYLDLDEHWSRGPAAGFVLDWETGRRPPQRTQEDTGLERGTGHLQAYAADEFQISEGDELNRQRRDLELRLQPKIDGFPRRVYDANLLFAERRKLDNAGPPSFDLEKDPSELRGMVDFQQHQPLQRFAGIDDIMLDFKYERQTDRDFMLEYFRHTYLSENQPEALASARKAGDNYSVELLYRGRTQEFDGSAPRSPVEYGTFSGAQPALTYSLAPTPMPYGMYFSGEAQGARLSREFDRMVYDEPGFTADRGYAKMDVARPIMWGPVNFVPHLGTQQQGYDDSRTGGGTSQGAATYGLDVTSRLYGTFAELENKELGVQGLHHVIEPRLSYSGVSNTTTDPAALRDFDQIDDLTKVNKVTLALDQTFQTKVRTAEGDTRNLNFAGFDMAMDCYPADSDQDRLLHGDNIDLFHIDSFLRVADAFKIDGSIGFEPSHGTRETASYGLTFDPHSRWRLYFSERFNYSDNALAITGSDQYLVRAEYQMSERWRTAYEQIYELRTSLLTRQGKQIERLTVTRSYGPLDVTFTYAIDRNFGNNAVVFSVMPVATYRNVVVPSQDLLVNAGEVSGDETEAPEERNFDPFDMFRAHKKRAGGKDAKNAPPAVPDQDAPVPPAPDSDKRTDKGVFLDPNAPADAGLFKDPKEAPPRRKRQPKVDEDDWTTPPPTPASTR
ncbi:MAG: hypothetical protein ABSE73_05410 [Planctomycetota bacterium]